jgi:hypothetical protein
MKGAVADGTDTRLAARNRTTGAQDSGCGLADDTSRSARDLA